MGNAYVSVSELSKAVRAVVVMDGLDRRRGFRPSDDHPAFQRVGGLPAVDRLVRHLASQDIVEICLVVRHLPGLVTHYFGDGSQFGTHISYIYQERPFGSGGALAQAVDFCTTTTLLVSGTLTTQASIHSILASHHASGADVTMALESLADTDRRPRVLVDEQSGRISSYLLTENVVEQHEMNLLGDAGIYLVEPIVIHGLTPDGALDWMRDILPALVEQRRVHGWPSEASVSARKT